MPKDDQKFGKRHKIETTISRNLRPQWMDGQTDVAYNSVSEKSILQEVNSELAVGRVFRFSCFIFQFCDKTKNTTNKNEKLKAITKFWNAVDR